LNASKQGLALTQLFRLALHHEAWREVAGRLRQRVTQSMTLGVRGIVLNAQNQVLLLRHTYLEGWYFPGGGMQAGESLSEGLTRELAEEAHISIDAPPRLHGIFLQKTRWRSNHVACFVIREFHQTSVRLPDWEIADIQFFDVDALPDDTTRATRARLDEVLHGQPISDTW
jgi:ADP-ribose pyrophosphatase YjhB (NUDIX family)